MIKTGIKNRILSSGTLALDEEVKAKDDTSTNNTSTESFKRVSSIGTSFSVKESITVTVDEDDSLVALYGNSVIWFSPNSGSRDFFQKLMEGAVELVGSETFNVPSNGIRLANQSVVLTGVSAGVHTYQIELRVAVSDNFCGTMGLAMFAAVVKLA